MYGLPLDFDLCVFKGKRLEMVCIAQFSIYFHFSGKILLTVEAPFLYESQTHNYSSGWVSFPISETKISKLLECEVDHAIITDNGLFNLIFLNKDRLIVSELKGYESYRIKTPSREVIV
jgi:hypothetical protein